MELLMEASQAGNIDGLYAAIRENANILAQIDAVPFVDTPLHAAASAGHIQYAREIMRLMPSFATKSNQDGFCPIHLALHRGHIQLVIWLVERDSDLVRLKGREAITPLHYVAEQGNLHLLDRFLLVCPKSIEDVTIRNETALHIALRNDMFEAFEFLVGRLHWDCHVEARYREKRILNWKDVTGNTVLHIATSKNQPQASSLVKLLISCIVDVNEKNGEGWTALDYVQDESQAEIRDLLCSAGAVGASSLPIIDNSASFLRTDQKLKMAAEVGDIQGLYSIIKEDQYLLERIDQLPLTDTPLHIAASKGHTQLALEIMRLKPSFAEKLNQDGFSPMHLALQSQSFQTALRLADVNGQLVCVKGRMGKTPVHFAAEKEELELLTALLIACPKSIDVVTEHKETALHIAAKNDKVEALKLLFGWLKLTGKNRVLNWIDDEGNTVLHIASRRNQIEVVRLLIGLVKYFPSVFFIIRVIYYDFLPFVHRIEVDLNMKNSEGLTAVDILQQEGQLDFWIILAMRAVAKRILPLGGPEYATGAADYFRRKISGFRKWAIAAYSQNLFMPDGNRNAVFVVAVSIATATYQAVLSPLVDFGRRILLQFPPTDLTLIPLLIAPTTTYLNLCPALLFWGSISR
ncbi:hypothetical protein GH714_010713 [Hevea brasiliensis]|uniref:Uncharacterized protein n=1 Tax=Hevea brasiliensis TaxID=3981 RepID=A0A6A6N1Q7_HEVBR|nr:hypothetical protein GH714_010713 [Hevea brasiliensis]